MFLLKGINADLGGGGGGETHPQDSDSITTVCEDGKQFTGSAAAV